MAVALRSSAVKRDVLVQALTRDEAVEAAREAAVQSQPSRYRIWAVVVEPKADGWFLCAVTLTAKW